MPSHKRNWKQYNKYLINRGNLKFWITPKALKHWQAKKQKKNGRPFIYSDTAIELMLIIRFKYQLSLRETEGLFLFLSEQLGIAIPSYTQLCRRMRSIRLPEGLKSPKQITDIVLDATGLKVYGEGEWCARKYGGKSKWVKLHLGMDPKTKKFVMVEVTEENVHDTALLEKALSKCNKKKGKVLFDGIADSKRCYGLCQRHNKTLLTPPNRKAIFRKEPEYITRNEALKMIKWLGGDELARSIWSKLSGYSKRSEIEGAIARWKQLLGGKLQSKTFDRIEKEVQIKGAILNHMIDLKEAM